MTVAINLPAEIEARLTADVRAGRHPTLEAAILERLTQVEDPNLLTLTGFSAGQLRADLDDAWTNRQDPRDGQAVFDRLAVRKTPSDHIHP